MASNKRRDSERETHTERYNKRQTERQADKQIDKQTKIIIKGKHLRINECSLISNIFLVRYLPKR